MEQDLGCPGSGGADFPFRPPLGGFQKVELRGRATWAGVGRIRSGDREDLAGSANGPHIQIGRWTHQVLDDLIMEDVHQRE